MQASRLIREKYIILQYVGGTTDFPGFFGKGRVFFLGQNFFLGFFGAFGNPFRLRLRLFCAPREIA
jgi:hypothetical protein